MSETQRVSLDKACCGQPVRDGLGFAHAFECNPRTGKRECLYCGKVEGAGDDE